ncbi:LysR family transcriptional regulator [Shimia abyssi]|uniref:DNA-binding transcriptional LysR family regulator n=1 Tax=Shimia abyssi TaxID=1662395 RepID=A0A2P8FFQ0_9RHOB|nr:LysR family transcriptional regulator [Shimia abyssi]PSL20546.1 DNA-binding transcriptional LysR family regulator [Shimia abyssi]
MQRSNLSLRGLEIFQLIAKSGSASKVSKETGLSISTISHHLRGVEESLGMDLVDHSKRPMILTPAGVIFARHVEEGLRVIRRGETELMSGNLSQVRDLRLGIVDELDSEVAPELAQQLSLAMPNCTFKHLNRPSHAILHMLHEKKLDVGVATRPIADVSDLIEFPLLRDPFVIALPINATETPEDCLAGRSKMPFLRYSQNLIIGNLIELHLRRTRVSLPNRFEFESNHSLLGMVAEGRGWAITTPASYNRAKRYQNRIALHAFQNKAFSRVLAVYCSDLYPRATAELIADIVRSLLSSHFVIPILDSLPWLSPDFYVLDPSST